MDVLACEPPHRFAVRSREPQPFSEDGQGEKALWEMELELREADGVTSLRFVQVLVPGATGVDMAASVGPGWDYYLDRLGAALAGQDVGGIDWEDYAGGSPHYRQRFA
jgi:hypothetical protein